MAKFASRMSMYRHHLTQAGVAAGADTVFTWCALPAFSTLRKIWLDYTIVGTTQPTWKQACMYVVDAYVIPIPDPDQSTAIADPNTLFDMWVPKDLDYDSAQEMDSDDTAVTAPTDTPGGFMSPTRLFGSFEPEQIFQRRTHLTATHPLSVPISATAWQPMDRIKTVVNKQIQVDRPSVILFGIGSPDLAATYDAFIDGVNERQEWLPTSVLEWNTLAYVQEVLRDWWRNSIGLTDGVSDVMIQSLQRWMEQAYIEDDGAVVDQAYDITGQATYQVSSSGSGDVQLTSR